MVAIQTCQLQRPIGVCLQVKLRSAIPIFRLWVEDEIKTSISFKTKVFRTDEHLERHAYETKIKISLDEFLHIQV